MDKLVNKIKLNKTAVKLIIFFNTSITFIVYLIYPILILYLWIEKDVRLKEFVLVPLSSFVLLSIYRKAKNAPRPYEVYDYEPILNKNSKGESFPSRHVFSIFVIASAVFYIYPIFGSILLSMGIILAMCRYLGGVHFLKDVGFGALFGILTWVLYLCVF